MEWGSHCVDLCQWANDADLTSPVEYEPVGGQLHARYPNGVKLVVRNEGKLVPLAEQHLAVFQEAMKLMMQR